MRRSANGLPLAAQQGGSRWRPVIINFRHLFGAFRYSMDGLKRGWKEQAFRHETLILPVIAILLFLIRPGMAWSAILAAAWLLLMALELLNSAIEEAFDMISPEFNIHVKYGKDMASAAIFMGILANCVLWLCMLWDRFGL